MEVLGCYVFLTRDVGRGTRDGSGSAKLVGYDVNCIAYRYS
jgi:hypothetical protein